MLIAHQQIEAFHIVGPALCLPHVLLARFLLSVGVHNGPGQALGQDVQHGGDPGGVQRVQVIRVDLIAAGCDKQGPAAVPACASSRSGLSHSCAGIQVVRRISTLLAVMRRGPLQFCMQVARPPDHAWDCSHQWQMLYLPSPTCLCLQAAGFELACRHIWTMPHQPFSAVLSLLRATIERVAVYWR